MTQVTVNQKELKSALIHARRFTDKTFNHLTNTIQILARAGTLEVLAADGYTLMHKKIKSDYHGARISCILQRDTANQLKAKLSGRAADLITLDIETDQITAAGKEYARAPFDLDRDHLDLWQLAPDHTNGAAVDGSELWQAAKRAKIFTDDQGVLVPAPTDDNPDRVKEKTNPTKLTMTQDYMTLLTVHKDTGQTDTVLDYIGPAPDPVVFGLDARRLELITRHHKKDQVIIDTAARRTYSESPILITTPDTDYLLMPMSDIPNKYPHLAADQTPIDNTGHPSPIINDRYYLTQNWLKEYAESHYSKAQPGGYRIKPSKFIPRDVQVQIKEIENQIQDQYKSMHTDYNLVSKLESRIQDLKAGIPATQDTQPEPTPEPAADPEPQPTRAPIVLTCSNCGDKFKEVYNHQDTAPVCSHCENQPAPDPTPAPAGDLAAILAANLIKARQVQPAG